MKHKAPLIFRGKDSNAGVFLTRKTPALLSFPLKVRIGSVFGQSQFEISTNKHHNGQVHIFVKGAIDMEDPGCVKWTDLNRATLLVQRTAPSLARRATILPSGQARYTTL